MTEQQAEYKAGQQEPKWTAAKLGEALLEAARGGMLCIDCSLLGRCTLACDEFADMLDELNEVEGT